MLARVTTVGRLVGEPEQRFTSSGTSVVSFSLATSEKYKEKEETCYIDCTVFGGLGEKVVMPYLHKGSQVFISGSLRQDSWTDQNGNKKSKHSVRVSDMQLLGSKGSGQPQQHNNTDDPQRHNVAGPQLNRPSRDQQAAQKPIHTPPVPEMDMSEVPF